MSTFKFGASGSCPTLRTKFDLQFQNVYRGYVSEELKAVS